MNLREYQIEAAKTAIFPQDRAADYIRLGLIGEVGELANLLKKVLRGDFILEDKHNEIEEELGGILWYIMAWQTMKQQEFPDYPFREYVKTTIRFNRATDYCIELAAYAYAPQYAPPHMYARWSGICVALGYDPETVARANLDLLAARQANGTLRGHNREE